MNTYWIGYCLQNCALLMISGSGQDRDSLPYYLPHPMHSTSPLSEGCVRELYASNRCESRLPCVQVLDFEESEANEKEINVRISDGLHFVDCTLSGNYILSNGQIVEIKNGTAVTAFKRLHIVKIDFFSKIDESRICKLKIMIRKMHEGQACAELIGAPQEIQQFMVNSRRSNGVEYTVRKEKEKGEGEGKETVVIKIENPMEPEPPLPVASPLVKTQKKEHPSNEQGFSESMTLGQILSGKDGYLIGRLVRLRATKKETKDGPMSVCYMGLTDRQGQLIRVHLAGRLAMNNEKNLRKGRSYYIRGFDIVNLKNNGPQIRLKDKEYKIVEIHNEQLTRQLPLDCYRWDHQLQQKADNEYVDVIGLIDDIEQKATYAPNSDSKSVIRIVVRNKWRSVRISFWSDQMRNFETYNLKRKEWIIIEDIRRKHSKYYDFSFESNLLRLTEHPQLQERFADLFPPPAEEVAPENVRELERLFQEDPGNSKLQTIRAYLSGFKESKLTYRLCEDCKKKVEREATGCEECGSNNLVYKYNCPLQFSDSTGSLVAVLFDTAAHRLIGRSAGELNEMQGEEVQRLFEGLLYRYYVISVQNRNQRLIVRNAQPLDQNQQSLLVRQNLMKIGSHCLREIW